MRKLAALVGMVLLAGCGKIEFGVPALDYEVVTRTQCLTTTADNVYISRENYWLNTGKIIEVRFSRDHRNVLFVRGEDFIMYREIWKEGK